ncbi:LA_2272/LA_2273 family lipoprotein [Leptospira santarosai]|uniref:LA_2272/LA_2273 family lipoprotein n=1 Tax=Leptospira santarosai TaxID=28183 RepID=UPI00036F6B00
MILAICSSCGVALTPKITANKVIRDYPDSYTKIEIFRLNLLSGEVHTLYGLNLGLVNKVLDKMHGIELGLINLPP